MENITGKRLELLREKKGWTKSLAAKKLNIKTVSTYANWEYGIRQPDNEMLVKIADLYEVSVDYLLGRTNNPNPVDSDGIEDIYKDEEFLKFANDPELERWFKELPRSKEEDLRKLRKMWEIIKSEED